MIITFEGKQYMRQVEMMGEVESVQWLHRDANGYTSGVYDSNKANRLELAYENIIITITNIMVPNTTII